MTLLERLDAAARRWPRTAIGAAMLASSLAVYLPYARAMDQVARYWDGPLYLYMARVFYSVPDDHPFTAYGLPANYFASHMPLYPLLIRVLTFVTFGDYPVAMIVATLLSAVACAVLFFEVLKAWDLVSSPLWTALLFCFLPPRWILYHAVGASEPLFFCFAFAAFLALKRERPSWVVACIVLASLTRITGVLLVPIFGLVYLHRRQWLRLALVPLGFAGILALFAFYHFHYGDFFAYSRWNVDRLGMLSSRPFAGFLNSAQAGNFRAGEFYVWMYLVYGLGTLALWKRREFFFYALVFFLFGAFVVAKDLTRYFLSMAPFALLVGFDPVLSRPACRLGLVLIVYLDYAYAWGFLTRNMVSADVYERLLVVLGSP